MKKWLYIGIVVWGLWGAYLVYYKNWAALEAIFTWMLAGGLFFAILQVYQASKSTNAQLAVELFRELREEKAIGKLRSIYILKPDDFKCLPDDRKEHIDYILDRFQMLGVLVAEGIIDKRLAIEAYAGASSLRCWYQLHQYIKELRNQRGDFGEYFEAFARLSLDYFYEEGKKVKFYREDEKDKGIDLKAELQKEELHPRSLEEIKRDRKRAQAEAKKVIKENKGEV